MKRAIGIGVAVVLGFVLFLARKAENEKVDAHVDATMETLAKMIDAAPGVEAHRAFIEKYIDHAHQYAISVAYTDPGRRRPADFDAQKYVAAVTGSLLERAKGAYAENQALRTFLTQLQIDTEKAAREGKFNRQ